MPKPKYTKPTIERYAPYVIGGPGKLAFWDSYEEDVFILNGLKEKSTKLDSKPGNKKKHRQVKQ